MPDHEQQWARQLHDVANTLQEGFAQAGRVFSTQHAMGWAFRGTVERVEDVVGSMSPDHLRQVSAAAALLGDAADQELGRRAS
jgi:hypothetical protein